jgi:autotransporter-associated beta strand protein
MDSIRRRRPLPTAILLSATAAALPSALPAGAATKTWTNANGTGVWSDGGNWSPAGAPPNPVPAADDLTFNASTSNASTVDAAWTVSTLNFKANAYPASFTLSGSPLTITRAVNNDSQVRFAVIQNAVTLAGTDNGRGPEVDFAFIPPAIQTGALTFTGPITGPARIHIFNAGRAIFNQAPQNTGGPLATLDPGGPNYGLLVDGPFGIFGVNTSAPGPLSFFGNNATAIGMTAGNFLVSHGSFTGVTTIANPFRIFTAGSDVATLQSSNFNFGTQHRLNLTAPMLLKGGLVLSRPDFGMTDTGVGGIGMDLQGTITVASTNAAIIDISAAPSDGLISGNITQDATPRTLTLGHDGSLGAAGILLTPLLGGPRVLQLSGDNTGLTGGIRVIGLDAPPGSLNVNRLAYRFLSLASMGGGGNGNVFIGPNGTAGIGFPLSSAALDKIDPASTGVIGIDADSSLDLDLSATGRNMPNVKIGSSVTGAQAPVHYTGHITPFGNTYQFGAPQSRGSLSLDAVNALSGPRGLNLGQGLSLILNAPQSFTGPMQIDGSLTAGAAGAIRPDAPIILNGVLAIGTADNSVPAYAHNTDITLGVFPGIVARKTTGGAGYDLLLNGSLRGGSATGQTFFGGTGKIVLNGPNNDFAGSTIVDGGTTLLVNSALSASTAPLQLSSFFAGNVVSSRLGGTGSILRPVMIDNVNTAILAPGGYPTPTGALTIDSLQIGISEKPIIYEFQFDAASNDFLKVLHDVTQDSRSGASILKLLPLGGGDSLGRTIPFLDVDGAITSPLTWTVDASLAPQYAGSFVSFDPTASTYSVTLVPEPATPLLIAAAAFAIARRRRLVRT